MRLIKIGSFAVTGRFLACGTYENKILSNGIFKLSFFLAFSTVEYLFCLMPIVRTAVTIDSTYGIYVELSQSLGVILVSSVYSFDELS